MLQIAQVVAIQRVESMNKRGHSARMYREVYRKNVQKEVLVGDNVNLD